jgi:dienelactone hydrolase
LSAVLQRAPYVIAALLVSIALGGLRAAVRSVPHRAAVLTSGAPAVVYEPPRAATAEADVRIPVVVLAHGLAGNARGMSALARRLARAGYGVVTFDFHGHGDHPDPVSGVAPGARDAALRRDFEAALVFARTQPSFDPERVALAGHSMGGSAALDLASFEPSASAVVAISGSRHWTGPYAPSNLLLIWASADSMTLRRQAEKLAAERANLQQVVLDRLYGDMARGSAVKASEVDGANHVSIVYSAEAAERIVAWLGRALGPGTPVESWNEDGRLPWCALGLLASAVLLWGLAGALGGVVPRVELAAPRRPALALSAVLLALAAGAWLAAGSDPDVARGPFSFIPLGLSRDVFGAFASAGLLLLGGGLLLGGLDLQPLGDARVWGVALLVWLTSFVLLGVFCEPLGGVWPTATRLPWIAVGFVLLLPFFACCELLLRTQGRVGRWLPPLARALMLAVLGVAVAAGALPEMAGFVVVWLVPVFVGLEIAAQRLASRAPHPWFSALLQSAWASGVLCAGAPLLG